MKAEEWYWFVNLEGIGIKKRKVLLSYYGDIESIKNAKASELEQIGILNKKDYKVLLEKYDFKKVEYEYNKLIDSGVLFLTKEDDRYPNKLLNIYDPPDALYVLGNVPKKEKVSIAIIGARNCSYYGREIAKEFARELSIMGMEVISGLARGIDSFAHIGALEAKGATFGVLGCGITTCYPSENIEIYNKMQINGGVISEYRPGISPNAWNFPMRNRIISGLSDSILVIEAKEKSGSLITVDSGLEQGKNIYAIPGRIDANLSGGCNKLIKNGAKMVTDISDILEDFVIFEEKISKNLKNNNIVLETKEKIVYANLSLEPKHIEQIAVETECSVQEIMSLLVSLEMKGVIKRVLNNYFVVK